MNVRESRNVLSLVLVAVLVAAASAYSFVTSYRSEVDSHRQVLLGRGQTVLEALKAGILAHGRMGRYRADRLGVIFEELARNPSIVALELRGPDGSTLAVGGRVEELPETLDSLTFWSKDRLVLANRIDLQEAFGPGGGGGGHGWRGREDSEEGWNPFAKGDHFLVASLDAAELNSAIARHRIQLAISLLVMSAALMLGTTAVALLLKRAQLAALLQQERERARRQEEFARLGAGLAHETKNPLGIIRGLAQSIGECSLHVCPVKDRAKNIVDEVDRAIGGLNAFLALARPKEAALAAVPLDAFMEGFLPLVQMDAAAAGVAVKYAPCRLTILADEELLRRALLNLIINALHASSAGGVVHIDTERLGAKLTLRITDAGCGIAPEDLPRVVEPYFTRFSGGSGLGLSIVEQIAAAHGWQLGIASEPGQGTRVALAGIALAEST